MKKSTYKKLRILDDDIDSSDVLAVTKYRVVEFSDSETSSIRDKHRLLVAWPSKTSARMPEPNCIRLCKSLDWHLVEDTTGDVVLVAIRRK